jgi:hypothetical protein
MIALVQKQLQQRMSALGQKQTCAVQNVMSALPPKATEIADINEGQSISALPLQGSNVDLLRYCKGIIHIDAEIPDSALYLGVAEQKLLADSRCGGR